MPKLRRIPSGTSCSSAVAIDPPVCGVYGRCGANGKMPSEERVINVDAMQVTAMLGADDVDTSATRREAVNAAKVFSISGGNNVSFCFLRFGFECSMCKTSLAIDRIL